MPKAVTMLNKYVKGPILKHLADLEALRKQEVKGKGEFSPAWLNVEGLSTQRAPQHILGGLFVPHV